MNRDYADLFRTFNDAEVRFIVVGAYAVVYHTEPRYTKDLDLWIDPTAENGRRVYAALAAFGAPLAGVEPDDFANPELVYQIGVEPNRIDILMDIGGLDFAACWQRSVPSSYNGVPMRVLALEDLIVAKRTVGRPQDLLDLERLTRARRG